MRVRIFYMKKALDFWGRIYIGALALLGTSVLTDMLNTWLPGYDEVVRAIVVISSVIFVFAYVIAPGLAEIYPTDKRN